MMPPLVPLLLLLLLLLWLLFLLLLWLLLLLLLLPPVQLTMHQERRQVCTLPQACQSAFCHISLGRCIRHDLGCCPLSQGRYIRHEGLEPQPGRKLIPHPLHTTLLCPVQDGECGCVKPYPAGQKCRGT